MKNNIRFCIGFVGLGFLAVSLLAQSASDSPASVGAPGSSVTFTSGAHTITVTDLGLPPGYVSARALAINNLGQIVGMATDSSFGLHRVIWDGGTFIELPNLDVSSTAIPEEINDAREVVGTELVTRKGIYYGVYWNAIGQVSALQPIAGGPQYLVNGHGINNLGQIVGFSQEGAPSLRSHAVRWPNGLSAPEDLGFMGSGQSSTAYGINDLGEVVGVADNGSTTHGFLWRNGTYTDLGSLAGSGGASIAYVINNSTVIAGSSNGGYLSFVWQNGVMTQLPFPPGIASTSVFDINNVGDIVGASATFFQEHAILWRAGEAIDLGTWPGGDRSFAWGINDSGTIVGEGNVPGGFWRALMWTADGGANTTPTPALQAKPTRINVGGSVSVKASFTDPDNGPWSYSLNWGDGDSTTGDVAIAGKILGISPHVYTRSGTFSASLSVTDAKGATGTSNTSTIRVR